MGDYKGPERRKKDQGVLGRRFASVERRQYRDRSAGRTQALLTNDSPLAEMPTGRITEGDAAMFNIKAHDVHRERRIGGAGRRAGDLVNALVHDKPVVFQAGKGALKKVAKKAGALGLGMSAISLAKELKVN
jgi:hypothetical protein